MDTLGVGFLEDAISQSNFVLVCTGVCVIQRFLKSRTVPFLPYLITPGPCME